MSRPIDATAISLATLLPQPAMHVSPSNVIRFPVIPVADLRRAATPREDAAEAADVVAFPAPAEPESLVRTVQTHGSLFAADRIVTRVADELDRIAEL